MSSLSSCVRLFLLFITLVSAHPGHSHSQPQRRSVDLEAYRFGGGGSYVSVPSASSTSKRSVKKSKEKATNQDTAVAFLMSSFPKTTFRLTTDHYVGDNGVEHFYFKQLANNLDIDNSNLNINVCHMLVWDGQQLTSPRLLKMEQSSLTATHYTQARFHPPELLQSGTLSGL